VKNILSSSNSNSNSNNSNNNGSENNNGNNSAATRLLVLSWVAVLCRDMPFAGLQIALFDVFKSLLSFLDDGCVNIFVQRALWGALAGSVAAWVTTPFDVLTTNIITAAQERPSANNTTTTTTASQEEDRSALVKPLPISSLSYQQSSSREKPAIISALQEVGPLFGQTMTDIFTYGGGFPGLFQGAVARMLFFGPAAMIFFASYESLFELISLAREGHAFWQK